MRQVGILLAAILLAGTVGACADPYYGYHRSYAYTSDAYYPQRYYAPAPVYYSNGPYYASPYYSSPYAGRSDYYRNYNGIHAPAELSQ
ncbi:MAG: hypothetical protein ACHQPH_24850 [Reyranellales bacterium]|jgi:hypothetical protein